MQRKRVGIIGLGDIAQKAYLPVLARHEGVDIVGVMSRSAETVQRIGEQYRIPNRYTDLAALLSLEPEAVFVHSPTETHPDIVLACLERGVHVYVDKPLSYDLRRSQEMVDAAERRGRLLAVGFNRRFAPLYVEAKAWIEAAGGFDVCIAQKHRVRKQSLNARQTIYDDLIHMLDLLVWLGCDPQRVSGISALQDEEGKLAFASGTLAKGPAAAFFSMSRAAGTDLERLELHGGGRSAEVTNLEQAVLSDRSGGSVVKTFGSWDTVAYRRGFAGIIDHFLQSIDAPDRCVIRGDRVFPVHELAERLPL